MTLGAATILLFGVAVILASVLIFGDRDSRTTPLAVPPSTTTESPSTTPNATDDRRVHHHERGAPWRA